MNSGSKMEETRAYQLGARYQLQKTWLFYKYQQFGKPNENGLAFWSLRGTQLVKLSQGPLSVAKSGVLGSALIYDKN